MSRKIEAHLKRGLNVSRATAMLKIAGQLAFFDLNFIRTGINHEISITAYFIILTSIIFKSLNLTCLFKEISLSLSHIIILINNYLSNFMFSLKRIKRTFYFVVIEGVCQC